MAQKTLPAVTPSNFPQQSGVTPQVFCFLVDRFVEDVSRIYEHSILPLCCYEYPESHDGACDGQPCSEKGTVHHIDAGLDFCPKHYALVAKALEAERG